MTQPILKNKLVKAIQVIVVFASLCACSTYNKSELVLHLEKGQPIGIEDLEPQAKRI